MASALQFYFQHGDSALALDNEDLFNTLLEDLYTAESVGTTVNRVQSIDLLSNKSTTSTIFVEMAGSGFNFTPSKPNFIARCSNILIGASVNTNSVEAEIRFNGVAGVQKANASHSDDILRPLDAAAKFEGVSVGVQHLLNLYWRVSAGTGTASRRAWLTWEIEEYD